MLVILSVLITSGCRTTSAQNELVLPPVPQRQELKEPESVKDLAEALAYYEYLVREWEAWGNAVQKLITPE